MKCVNIKLLDLLACFHYILNAPHTCIVNGTTVISDILAMTLFSRNSRVDSFNTDMSMTIVLNKGKNKIYEICKSNVLYILRFACQ